MRGTAALSERNAFPNRRGSSFSVFVGRDLYFGGKGADKARREEKIFFFGCWAAQLWLRSLKELLPLNQWVALVTRWLLLGTGSQFTIQSPLL